MDKGVGIGEVIALHKALGGGGGSSGGGVLVVHQTVTQDGNNTLYTLDKTYKELTDAINGGTIPYMVVEGDSGMAYSVNLMNFYVQYAADNLSVQFGNTSYDTDSQNGYPVHTESRK